MARLGILGLRRLATSAEVRHAKFRAKEPAMKVLMVLASHDKLGDTGRKTGFW
jgi:hypothetical protein